MRVLESGTKEVDNSLVEKIHDGMGYRMVFRGTTPLCDDSPTAYERASRFAMIVQPRVGQTVAWLGGGLGVGPKLFALFGCSQTIYEAEAALSTYVDGVGQFIPGLWQDTLTGNFDAIICDTGEPLSVDDALLLKSHCTLLVNEP